MPISSTPAAICGAALALGLAACASKAPPPEEPVIAAAPAPVPAAPPELEQARSAYRAAAAAPEVELRAPVELAIARRALERAERLWRDGASETEVSQEADLAAQQARIAQKSAESRKAEAAQLEPPREEPHDLKAEMKRLQAQVSDLKSEQTARGWVLTLRSDVLFDSGSAMLKPGARRTADLLAQFLRRNPGREIAVEGFTDSTGPSEANRRLSQARAAALKQALVARGIEPGRIDARGYGPSFPVASNETPTGRELNRRVEIIVNPS